MTAYLCSSRNEYIEGHHPEECLVCLRAMRDAWKLEAGADLVERLRHMDRRILDQRKELSRLNKDNVLYQTGWMRARAGESRLAKAMKEILTVATGSLASAPARVTRIVDIVTDALHPVPSPREEKA